MRVTILGSGSEGNATLFEGGGASVLIDAGLSLRQIRARALAARGRPLETLDAVVITHAHTDHVAHAQRVAQAYGAQLFAQRATAEAWDLDGHCTYEPSGTVRVGGLTLRTTPLPHDAAQVGVVVSDGDDRVGLVTDLGHVPRALPGALRSCRTLLLESNHDVDLLRRGPYPASLRARIAGPEGHLSNAQAAGLLARLAAGPLERVVLMHLSKKTNTPELALAAARRALEGHGVAVLVASQGQPLRLEDDSPRQLSLGFG